MLSEKEKAEAIQAREKELVDIVNGIDEEKARVLKPIVGNLVYMESRLTELRELPQIRVNKKNPAIQQTTPAAKLYKETMQSYLNAVKVVLMALYREGGDAGAELMEKLSEFQL